MTATQKTILLNELDEAATKLKIPAKWRQLKIIGCQKFSFFTESRDHCGVKTQERESGAGGGGGEREVKRKFYMIHRIGRADKEN